MKVVDTNLLIYAVNASAPLHTEARSWWERVLSGTEPIGIPWVVALGFARITTRSGILESPLSVKRAVDYVSEWLEQPYVSLLVPGERHWNLFGALLVNTGSAGNLTTDVHIAALAIEHGGTVYSTDYDFRRFDQLAHVNPLAPH